MERLQSLIRGLLSQRPERFVVRERLLAIVMIIAALWLAAVSFSDYWRSRPGKDWSLVGGKIIARESIKLGWLVTRPKLTIRIDGSDVLVHAVLHMNAASGIPDRVRFLYSGDPAKEVTLEEETSSLLGTLLGLGLACGLVVVWPS